MKGIVLSYRRGRHTQNPKQVIIRVEGVESKEEAMKLVGKKVIWRSKSGKEIVGVITAPHGSKGKVRARFEKGLPGQALGTEVEIV